MSNWEHVDKEEIIISEEGLDEAIHNAYLKGRNDVLDEIMAEIDDQYKWLMQTKHTLYDIDIAFSGIKSFIDKHIGGDTE